ncbi:FG-GAP-like repeat-containing protein [Trueperella bialowiezensis]|nr:FG-GAP-like repeat-containing protein [Trueperella bialowiezensis]
MKRIILTIVTSLALVFGLLVPAHASTIKQGYSMSLLARQEGTNHLYSYGGGRSELFARGRHMGNGWGGFDYGFQIDSLSGGTYGDVIVRSPDGLLRIYHSTGSALYGGYQIGKGWHSMTAMVPVSDWDGDGRPDILARTSDGRLLLYPTRGAGSWGTVRQIGQRWNGMDIILSPGDLTSDRHADVIAREKDTGLLYLYPGNGRGGFLPPQKIGYGWTDFVNIASFGDMNGDGIPDIIGQHNNGRLYLYPGMGNGYFRSARQIGHGWQNMTLPGPWEVTAKAGPPAPRPRPKPAPRPKLRQPFVYGTLRTGDIGYHMVKGRTVSERYATVPGYQLWVTHSGKWPWAVKGAASRPLLGQVMEFPASTLDANLRRLDVYEGYYPDRPRNSMRYWRAPATTSDGAPVWIYQTTDRQARWVTRNGYLVHTGDWFAQGRSGFRSTPKLGAASIATDIPVTVTQATPSVGCTSDLGTLTDGDFLEVDFTVTAPDSTEEGYVSVPAESFVAIDSRGFPVNTFDEDAKFCSAREDDSLISFVDDGTTASGTLTLSGRIAQLYWIDDSGTAHLIWANNLPTPSPAPATTEPADDPTPLESSEPLEPIAEPTDAPASATPDGSANAPDEPAIPSPSAGPQPPERVATREE